MERGIRIGKERGRIKRSVGEEREGNREQRTEEKREG